MSLQISIRVWLQYLTSDCNSLIANHVEGHLLIGYDRKDMRFQPTGTTLDKIKSSKDPRLGAWYWSLFLPLIFGTLAKWTDSKASWMSQKSSSSSFTKLLTNNPHTSTSNLGRSGPFTNLQLFLNGMLKWSIWLQKTQKTNLKWSAGLVMKNVSPDLALHIDVLPMEIVDIQPLNLGLLRMLPATSFTDA